MPNVTTESFNTIGQHSSVAEPLTGVTIFNNSYWIRHYQIHWSCYLAHT